MNYPSIQIYGNILSPDLPGRLDSDETLVGQKPKSFGLESHQKVRDEISQAWSLANSYYKGYRNRLEKLKPGQSGESETRSQWIYPLFGLLGYTMRYEKTAQIIQNKTYHITDPVENLDDLPIIITGFEQNLDKKPTGLRMSPHALMQEYLNYNENHLYGLVTNGRVLRLLRDSGRIIRLSYFEVDLERIFDEGLYPDFAAFYRLFHASRLPQKQTDGPECLLEQYHLDALESGTRIREKLSYAVEEAIIAFGKGFLAHPANAELREAIENGRLQADTYYRYLLRLIYRLLFLMVIEERNLVYPDIREEEIRRLREIYYRYYSVGRLRLLTRNPWLKDARYSDLWKGLQSTFRLFESSVYGQPLKIVPLDGELFSASVLGWLDNSMLDNKTFLTAFEHLSWFTSPNGSQQPVNYKLLNVEEFGSVYEGLLEYDPVIQKTGLQWTFDFKKGTGRSSSGSHYTPEELVQPLIKHSLDYLLTDREALIKKEITQQNLYGEARREAREKVVADHLLTLKVADVACGSGHILLSAARRIADRYAAWVEESDQPTPSGQRHAIRLVIRNCIYGVDKNPLAVELCKVALWLEAHNPGEPLSFLDHHIKCGDAIVGLAHREELENGIATEAFKTLPGDNKEIAQTFARKNKAERNEREDKLRADQLKASFNTTINTGVQEAMAEYRTFSNMPEKTPEEIAVKSKAYRKFLDGKGYSFLKNMADAQAAQFFNAKTEVNKNKLITDADYRQMLRGYMGWQNQKTAFASVMANEKRFFHWFLEFPEVFNEGGFDCILGNPPYLGGSKISGAFGKYYLEYLHNYFENFRDKADLIACFVQRIFSIISSKGFCSVISTNTISEGVTREASLDLICKNGLINYAFPDIKWPGEANVIVTLVCFTKIQSFNNIFIGNSKIQHIGSLLTVDSKMPKQIFSNRPPIFYGSKIQGEGFFLSQSEVKELEIYIDDVIFRYINASQVLNYVDYTKLKWIVNFSNFDLDFCRLKYHKLLQIIEPRIIQEKKEFEISLKLRKDIYNERDNKILEKWWQYEGPRVELYKNLHNLKYALVIPRVTKTHAPVFLPKNFVFSDALLVVASDSYLIYSVLQSSLHDCWAWHYSSRLKTDRRYSPSDAYETFPLFNNESEFLKQNIELKGETYHKHRSQLMLELQFGLTKIYNVFHVKEINENLLTTYELSNLSKDEIEKRFGKEVRNLWNHLQKTTGTVSIEEAVAGIIKLRQLHVEMDNAVLEAYGWQDVPLKHDFYEVDHLPENDRIRYTIHPDARKEILKRLLVLNHKIHDEEVKAGLWDKKKPSKEKKQNKTESPDPSSGLFGYGGLWDELEK